MSMLDTITVNLTRRDDGGLQAECDAVPGFYLSGKEPDAVLGDVIPAIKALLKINLGFEVDVVPLYDKVADRREFRIEPRQAA